VKLFVLGRAVESKARASTAAAAAAAAGQLEENVCFCEESITSK
jgi:hypothetical protein